MKYELLKDDTIELPNGVTLYRIRACREVRPDVPEGTLGGYIQNYGSLSRVGSSWIYNDAQVYGSAAIYGDAKVYGNAKVFDSAEVYGNAKVFDNAKVYGSARVCDYAQVCGDARVYGNTSLFGHTVVAGNARVHGHTIVHDLARVHDNAILYGAAVVCDDAMVYGNAEVGGGAVVCGHAVVCGNAEVVSSQDYMVFKNSWTSDRWFTYTTSNRQWKVGCFLGSGEALIRKAYADCELSGKCYEAIVRAVETIEAAKGNAETGRQASRSSGMDL